MIISGQIFVEIRGMANEKLMGLQRASGGLWRLQQMVPVCSMSSSTISSQTRCSWAC